MENNPFISVCIPAYKNPIYVERLLNSINIQSYRDFEIVITDNSPDDSIGLLVNKFKDRLFIKYYKNNPAVGMAENFNEGLGKANGKWIKMMHDDDWFSAPDALDKFAAVARQTDSKFIFCAYNDVYSPSGKIKSETLSGWRKEMLEENPFNLFYLNVIGHPSVLMHRNERGMLYDTKYKWVVDIDFYIRFLNKYPGFDYIPDSLVNISIDENQMSSKYYKNPAVEIPEYLSMLAKYPAGMPLQNEYVFYMLWMLVKKFKIRNLDQILRAGYQGPLPEAELKAIIAYQRPIPNIILKQTPWSKLLMKRCFSFITRKNKD
jgi:glycosyltransferase involved in cell wall biosynthesis